MILPTRWRDVRAPARVLDPAGVVWHVLPPAIPGLPVVTVRDAAGNTRCLPIDPDTFVPMLYDHEDVAVAHLGKHFDLEYLRG